MAGEKTTLSSNSHYCNQDALYVVLAILAVSVCVCVVLIYCIIKLKRRQNGYSVIRGNEDEVQKYKDFYEEEKRKTKEALQKVEMYKDMHEEAQKEKEDALQRLSKLMSDRLTDGNPNIANLNDAKRPTKLAEDFSELYDNEWTGAFDCIEGEEEKKKIDFLLHILQISFGWCRLQTKEQMQKLKCLILYPGQTYTDTNIDVSINQEAIKGFKDCRKLQAEKTGKHVSEKVLEAVQEKFKGSEWKTAVQKKTVEDYCRRCAELSWFLAVQDPPMDVKFSDVRSEDVKAYTKSGNEMDFVVWPPLYLQEKGSLMSKGIAQFRMK